MKTKLIILLIVLFALSFAGTVVYGQDSNVDPSKNNINALFTLDSLLSLQGAAVAAVLVPNVFGMLFGPRFNRWKLPISFIISMILAYLAAIIATTPDLTKFVVAFFNGILIFSSAAGVNQGASQIQDNTRGDDSKRSRFFTDWFSEWF